MQGTFCSIIWQLLRQDSGGIGTSDEPGMNHFYPFSNMILAGQIAALLGRRKGNLLDTNVGVRGCFLLLKLKVSVVLMRVTQLQRMKVLHRGKN